MEMRGIQQFRSHCVRADAAKLLREGMTLEMTLEEIKTTRKLSPKTLNRKPGEARPSRQRTSYDSTHP